MAIRSGNGAGPRDTEVEFRDAAGNWQPAFIVAPNAGYDVIQGTQYVGLDANRTGAAGTTTRYGIQFDLPPGCPNTCLTFRIQIHADNAAIVYLNGVEIGRHLQQVTTANFRNPPEVFTRTGILPGRRRTARSGAIGRRGAGSFDTQSTRGGQSGRRMPSGYTDSVEHERIATVEAQLARWQGAGLIDEEQARRIVAFERDRSNRDRDGDTERPSAIEAVLYLGIAVAVVGVVTLIAQNWDDLRTWARFAVLAVPGVLLVLAGLAMRMAEQPAVRRASGIAWLAAVALLSGAAAVAGHEGGWRDRDVWLLAGSTAAVLALGLWTVYPSQPQVVGVAGSLVVLAIAAAQWVESYEAETTGLLLAVFGALMIATTEAGRFGPTTIARLLSAAGIMAGLNIAAYVTDSSIAIELLVFVAGVALIGLGLWRADFGLIVVAVGGLFLGLVFFIFRHFEEDLGAPLALLLTGTLVIAGVLLLALLRGRVKAEAAS